MREDLRNFRFKRIRSRGARREMKKTKDMTLILIEFKLDFIRRMKKKRGAHNSDVKPPGSQSPSNRIWVSTPCTGFSP